MKEILEKAEVKFTEENKKRLDKQINEVVGIDYKNCPNTWKSIKDRIEVDEQELLWSLSTFM